MLDKAIYTGLILAAVCCLVLASLSTEPSLEACMAKINNESTCRYALR